MFEAVKKALILDPPRRGCDREVLECADGFDRIVYISCNPQTLARDIKILSEKYDLTYIQPFDMFPQTANVETLVLLSKKNRTGISKSTSSLENDNVIYIEST